MLGDIAVLALGTLATIDIGKTVRKRLTKSRNWKPDFARHPQTRISGSILHVRNVRNTSYVSRRKYQVRYHQGSYALTDLQSVDFLIEPIYGWRGIAHTMLTFGFSDGRYLVVSVEQRRQVGERYSPVRGMLPYYELIYVFGEEQDLIRSRTNYRNHPVWLYPLRLPKRVMQEMLVAIAWEANRLEGRPAFYNTLTETCTTRLIKHLNEVRPGSVPYRLGVFLPGFAGQLLYRQGLIKTRRSFKEARERFRIDGRARECDDMRVFSQQIRQRIPAE